MGGRHPRYGTVSGSPVKSFFVTMLTRDIELEDAILDLLDNCVDGLLRTLRPSRRKRPYAGKRVYITFSDDLFTISDNCGGIPWRLHNYAFRLGRPEGATPTPQQAGSVGVYGIGMKRAIFKMGQHCLISTQNGSDRYEVDINLRPARQLFLRDKGPEPAVKMEIQVKNFDLIELGDAAASPITNRASSPAMSPIRTTILAATLLTVLLSYPARASGLEHPPPAAVSQEPREPEADFEFPIDPYSQNIANPHIAAFVLRPDVYDSVPELLNSFKEYQRMVQSRYYRDGSVRFTDDQGGFQTFVETLSPGFSRLIASRAIQMWGNMIRLCLAGPLS